MSCVHKWSVHNGYCVECGVLRSQWIREGNTPDPNPRSEEDQKRINLSEQELGMDMSKADNWTREYLVGTRIKSNGIDETKGG